MDFNVVLVGLTGHGKSATGNSILGREAFISRALSSSVTETCKLETSVLEDGRTISVIDTTGFLNKQSELPGEEVEKCFRLARDRIHAFLFVVSMEQGISTEDGIDAVGKLMRIFGENIINYMILVFTHGDAWPYNYNREFADLYQRRYVFFDNKTNDEAQKSKQIQKLLSEVKTVMSKNGGKPFMSQVFELQVQVWAVRDATTRLEHQLVEMHATTMNANKEQTTQIIDVVEARLRDTTTSLEQQMEAATLKADERAEKYLKEETSELIQWITSEMTQRLEAAVEQRVLDMATQQMKVNEQMTQRINEEVESMKDVTTRLVQQLAEAEAARLKADERAQEAQKNSDEQTQKLKEVLERAEAARLKADERAQEAQKNSDEQTQKLKEVLERAEAARLKADERAQEAQKNSDEQTQKLKEVLERAEAARLKADERAQEAQKNSDEQTQKLKEVLERAEAARLKADERAQKAQKNSDEQTQKLKEVLERAEAARLKVDERAQEAQKNSDEHIQKLKEVLERAESRRSETISDFESSSFHVYDPSTYLLQSAIK